jgi:hypothetical protein
MPAFAEMLNNAMFNFRKVIKADLNRFFTKSGSDSYKRAHTKPLCRSVRKIAALINSAAMNGFGMCIPYPAANARFRSSIPA